MLKQEAGKLRRRDVLTAWTRSLGEFVRTSGLRCDTHTSCSVVPLFLQARTVREIKPVLLCVPFMGFYVGEYMQQREVGKNSSAWSLEGTFFVSHSYYPGLSRQMHGCEQPTEMSWVDQARRSGWGKRTDAGAPVGIRCITQEVCKGLSQLLLPMVSFSFNFDVRLQGPLTATQRAQLHQYQEQYVSKYGLYSERA